MDTTPNKTTIPTLALNLQLIRSQWQPFTAHSLLTVLIFAEQLVPGLIIKAVFDTLATSGPLVGPNLRRLWGWIALYVAVEVARILLGIGYEYFGWTFRLRCQAVLVGNLFASILRRPGDLPLPVASGEALNRFRFDEDMGEVTDFPTWFPDQVGKWIAAAVAVVIMARINLPITLVIFLPLVGVMFLTRLIWGKRLVYSYRCGLANDAVSGFLGESFGAVQAVKVAGAEADVTAHLTQLNATRRAMELRAGFWTSLLNALSDSVVNFSIGVMLLMAASAPATLTACTAPKLSPKKPLTASIARRAA